MGEVLQMRDYETAEERQIAIDRIALRVVSEALDETTVFPTDFPSHYRAPPDEPA